MSRNRGRRYSGEQKLNLKKVFAVIIVIIVVVMFFIGIKKLLAQSKGKKISNESYFAVFENDKYGVINSKGEIVIEPSYGELIVIPNQNKDVFICTYDIDYSNGNYKTKALNAKNDEIYKNYDGIEALENYDKNNNIVYNTSVLKTKKNNKYGLITIDGKELLSCDYDEILALKGNENSIIIKKDGKCGLVDNNGKKVIDTKYKEIKKLQNDYKNGYIIVDENGKYGTVDCANNVILATNYLEIKPIYENGMYAVKGIDGYNIVEKNGNIITKKEYQNIKDIKNDQIIVQENNKYGVIKSSGEQILACTYDDISFISTDAYIVRNNNKYGIVNSKNEQLLEIKYNYINYIKEADIIEVAEDDIISSILNNKFEKKLTGIISEINTQKGYLKIRMEEDYRYYNFKFEEKTNKEIFPNNEIFLSKKDGKYGFVDKDGKIIADYIYDDGAEANNFGYASVNKDGKWGSIDKNGNIVAPVDNDLSSNTIIDFIGRWHLMRDVNLNCYTRN